MAREQRGVLLCAALLHLAQLGWGQAEGDSGNGFSLHPPYLDLAEGARIQASATCGEDDAGRPRLDLYCKLVGGPEAGEFSQTIQGQYCDHCRAEDRNKAHPITNAIDGTEHWWQSPPLSRGLHYNQVNITLNLGQLYHVAYILIKFANSPRPDLWVLERSVDFGRTYNPWQYFAHSKRDCEERFGTRAHKRITKDDDVVCTTEYSRIVPLENGEVVVSLVNGRPGATNFIHSPVLRDFTKATNIRLRFLRTNTLLGHLISKTYQDPTVTRRYYYSIKDISIGGRCVCNGHAAICEIENPNDPFKLQCRCQHHTCGDSCESCCPEYNQKPWQPASRTNANECEPCNCHGHAHDCYYDPEVNDRGASLNINRRYEGGGVCRNCQHNTAGVNCEQCATGYFRPFGVSKEAPDGCRACSCRPEFTDGCEDGTGQCRCKPNFSGEYCDTCAPGYHNFPQCIGFPVYPTKDPSAGHIENCKCNIQGTMENTCLVDPYTQRCACKPHYTGAYCEDCAPGYFGDYCSQCYCYGPGVADQACNTKTGQCTCRGRFQGFSCEICSPGFYDYPFCQPCSCDRVGSFGTTCNPAGECQCRPNFMGQQCRECAQGYYGYPVCSSCDCSTDGSYDSTCDQSTGECKCLPRVTGRRCDTCVSGTYNFPHCQVTDCHAAGTARHSPSSHSGSCECLANVEGPKCDKCKALYWKLAEENPDGCIECQCVVKGTTSRIGICNQDSGMCHCKPNVCGKPCDVCKKDYYALEEKNYFGCQGCQCDIGGSVNLTCSDRGICQCRQNVEGRTCNRPQRKHYFPDLHHLTYEIEDGTTPNGRPVRFGYDPQEFPNFSWRGYTQMSPIQPEVVTSISVASPNLFHVMFRYKNHARNPVSGRISITEENNMRVTVHVEKRNLNLFRIVLRYINTESTPVYGRVTTYQARQSTVSPQTKEVLFTPTKNPAFATVSGNSYAEPFSLTPGSWIVNIVAEGVLLDYLVLVPSDYYEASILQYQVSEPCPFNSGSEQDDTNCLLYRYLPLDHFPSSGAEEGIYLIDGQQNTLLRPPTSFHPELADLVGRQVQLQFRMKIPQPGHYVIVLEYANEEERLHILNVSVNSPLGESTQGQVNLYSCKYRFLCRSIAVDPQNRIAVFHSPAYGEVLLRGTFIRFLLHKIYFIPFEEFHIEFVEPKMHCISTHEQAPNGSNLCVASKYEMPVSSVLVKKGRLSTAAFHGQDNLLVDPQTFTQRPPTMVEPADIILLKFPQNQIIFNALVPNIGRYVVVVHFYQPLYQTFPVEVLVDGGTLQTGVLSAFFCPHGFGCRNQVISGNRIQLEILSLEISLTLTGPRDKAFWVDYILIIPADKYDPDLKTEKPLDKSFHFINACGGESLYIDPATSSKFCQDAVKSLVAFHNDGAVPCQCDREGATSQICQPAGGQCPCRPHVIGRRCNRCTTGYYSFPNCRPCNCGMRLCDEVTGHCICPPQTVKPQCETCIKQTFSYHPMAGCEQCNCSQIGIVKPDNPDCDSQTGQCRCKSQVIGRQCDQCSAGYYRYPDCLLCDCNQDGTRESVCDPSTGQCLCKENVEGKRCNICRSGSFHLDPDNPKGCTSCFCFGVTNQCHGSDMPRTKYMKMSNWMLVTGTKQRIPVVYNQLSKTVVADTQELPTIVHDLYWLAPESYLRDKISSYGGFLTYQIKSFGLPSEGMTLLEQKSDVQLRGDKMTIEYFNSQNPIPDRVYHGRVQLVEDNFRHAVVNTPVTREELMLLLSNLEELRIRALYFSQTQRLSLGRVELEETSATARGSPATNVEVCSCPPNYLGDSCQHCRAGYYRERLGFYLGRCVPCRCNRHSDKCLDRSGICVECKDNTEGDQCERCKPGFYGNAVQNSCSACPCPLTVSSNNFATGCAENNGRLQCFCKPGYSGENCERCAPGYFGNPAEVGGQCRHCQCGSSNPTSCDPQTGQCAVCPDCTNEEPKDTSSDEKCDVCDSCVKTLLGDLNKMDIDLQTIKLQVRNANASAAAQERMNALDRAITSTGSQLRVYRNNVERQTQKTNDLENDNLNLIQDVNALEEKAEMADRRTQTLLTSINKTARRADDMLISVENVLQNILDLINRLGSITSGSVGERLAEAERMLKEMRSRKFHNEKLVAEREKSESKKLFDHIKNNLATIIDENKELANKMKNDLNLYQSKLQDLHDAMTEATNLTKKADDLNKINTIALENIKEKANELSDKEKDVSDLLRMADRALIDLNLLLKRLDDSQEEYEKQGAELDGALSSLNRKVNQLSDVTSKEPIVIRAEKHAEQLHQLANSLEKAIQEVNQDSLIQRVRNASEAYENIINAVNAAEAAAKKADVAAGDALKSVVQDGLAGKATELNVNSNRLLSDTKKAEVDLEKVVKDLKDAKDRLSDAEKKKVSLLDDLPKLQQQLDKIKPGNINETLNRAKEAASEANDTAAQVMDKLQPILADLKNFNATEGNFPNMDDFNRTLSEAEDSVNTLMNTLPSLVEKLNNLTKAQTANNISENIDRIRDLIEQAREAANKINVPMKFNGKSGVEVRLPKDLNDLKAYNSLKLHLKRPNEANRGDNRRRRQQPAQDMFVLYLGPKNGSQEYIGMALVNEKLVTVYKLGENQEAKIESDFIVSTAFFDNAEFKRILKYGSLTYEKIDKNDINPVTYTTVSDGKNMLLNLDPQNTVFYVGGFPSSFKPPSSLDYANFIGDIELGVLNERHISLYNFKEMFNVNTTIDVPNARDKGKEIGGYYFDGTGYAQIKVIPKVRWTFEQNIISTSKNAVLMYLESENSSCALVLENGMLVFRYNLELPNPPEPVKLNILKISDPKLILRRNISVDWQVALSDTGMSTLQNINLTSGSFTQFYLGGIPSSIKQRLNIPVKSSLRACVKNVKVNSENKDLSSEVTVGVSKHCSENLLLVRSASFSSKGVLQLSADNIDFPDDFHIGFGFSTIQLNSLLFSYVKDKGIRVLLENGKLKVFLQDKVLQSENTFNDGANHYVSVIKIGNSVDLNVDDRDMRSDSVNLQEYSNNFLYVGGSQETMNYTGCINDVFIKRNSEYPKVQNLKLSKDHNGVKLDTCSRERAPEMLMLKEGRKSSQETVKGNKNGKNHKDVLGHPTKESSRLDFSGCQQWRPKVFNGAHQFGDSPDSHLEYDLIPESFKERSKFSVDVRTVASEGIIFYVADKAERSYMALYLLKGRFFFSFAVDGNKLKIKSKAKYNDGQWHTVVFSREGHIGKLVIDGLRTRQSSISTSLPLEVESPFYLGGLPSGKGQQKKLPRDSFQGCIRNFKLDGSQLSSPSRTLGVTPCFDGKSEPGAYFSAEGGYVILDNAFVVGRDFELLFEVRARSQTGVLFHISSPQGNYLSLYMNKGKVTVSVNNGAGEFSTSVTPQQSLCNGQSHRIAVIKRNNVVQLDVDAERDHVIGPAASRFTDTKDPLYVGGVPDAVQTPYLPVRTPFIGCMQSVVINEKSVTFSKAAEVYGAVSVTRCPTM